MQLLLRNSILRLSESHGSENHATSKGAMTPCTVVKRVRGGGGAADGSKQRSGNISQYSDRIIREARSALAVAVDPDVTEGRIFWEGDNWGKIADVNQSCKFDANYKINRKSCEFLSLTMVTNLNVIVRFYDSTRALKFEVSVVSVSNSRFCESCDIIFAALTL